MRFRSVIHRYLEPSDTLAEVLFGLIMVLTFTVGDGPALEVTEFAQFQGGECGLQGSAAADDDDLLDALRVQ